MRITRLPWYDFSFLLSKQERLWSILKTYLTEAGLSDLPEQLGQHEDLDSVLKSPRLLFSQTCGYDVAVDIPCPLTLIYTPSYHAPGCGTGTYRSFVVVNENSPIRDLADLSNRKFVANDDRSWSGYHCLREFLPGFSEIHFTGSHCISMKEVKSGKADVAAIDCIVWEMLRLHQPQDLEGLRIIASTPEVPAPPLVTHHRVSSEELAILRLAFRKLHLENIELCRELLIRDFVLFRPKDYSFMAANGPNHHLNSFAKDFSGWPWTQ